jgi:hypothetical protein
MMWRGNRGVWDVPIALDAWLVKSDVCNMIGGHNGDGVFRGAVFSTAKVREFVRFEAKGVG